MVEIYNAVGASLLSSIGDVSDVCLMSPKAMHAMTSTLRSF